MAARLLSVTLIRSVSSISIYGSKRIHPGTLRWPGKTDSPIQSWETFSARTLHTKVLDKEANWEAQREMNRHRTGDVAGTDITSINTPENVWNTETNKTFRTIPIEDDGIRVNEDSDVFGREPYSQKEDEGDLAEEEYINNPPRKSQRLSQIQYVRLIKEQLIAKRLQEAIDVLEKRMKKDRVKPETYTYNLIISGCAKAGYTRKAFSLFNKMRQSGLKVTGGTYTSLFNACANAPSAIDGLNRANHVREIMLEKGVELNLKNYNAMIKAYGRWGDVETAFQLVDEMKEKKILPTAETFNFLLQACASDSKFGFRHCLLTWHKMLKSGFKPDYYSFNAVLRCVRDCGFGDLETMHAVLTEILGERQAMQLSSNTDCNKGETTKLLMSKNDVELGEGNVGVREKARNPFKTEAKENDMEPFVGSISGQQNQNGFVKARSSNPFRTEDNEICPTQTPKYSRSLEVTREQVTETGLEIPNLLAPKPHLGSMVSLSEIAHPHERFLLLGGLTGFLDLMKQNNITPDIQTFTMLLEVIPPTNSAEKQVLAFIRRIGLKADIDFFNVLIKKRSMRFDYDGAKEVLSMISTAGLQPDIVTYGVLALGCRTQEEARELLQELHNKGIRMNIQILGAMLRQGCAQRSFPYVCEIIQICLDENIKPNDVFLRHLNNFYTQCARAIDSRHPSTKTKNFKKQHARFCDKLRLFNEENGIAGLKLNDAIKVIQEGPYQQYKEAKIEGLEPEKNESLSRKQKIRKYIKKIKIANLREDDPSDEEGKNPRQTTTKPLIS